ncbi:PPE domain-containing protein [Actinophytocola gossypii]|uniref:PPE domain-containing protein n=1 Tax=Actinophytocola gossypii TaxID=2812003 RepID=A0ABT2JK77_9PSEU|nr:PPE domain-containing protein [Actinophytocola gossypii]MCT2588297.1 PPE domain-containing protein [Actinophytocola gossypii]
MTSIAPGGCHPPHWPSPPTCYPPMPLPPEEEPTSLDEQVDYLTFTHRDLHRMVHQGLDPSGAMEVSADWARLGDELTEISEELGRIVTAAAAAWEGEASDLARQTLAGLTHWAAEAGTQATKVSACVTMEVDNVLQARDAMPKPPREPIAELPEVQPLLANDWGAARSVTADPAGPLAEEQAMHQQAARVMERFQEASREVYSTVPQFSPPPVGGSILVGPPQPPPPPQPPVPPPPTPPAPVPVPPPLPPRTGVPGSPGVPGAPGSTGTPGRVPVGGPTPGPTAGLTSGAGEPAAAQNRPGAGTTSSSGRGPSISGMPMGMGAAGRDDDTERRVADYLKEEDDIWGQHERPTTPPVIGEERPRA